MGVRLRTPETDIRLALRNTPLAVAQRNLLVARSRVVERRFAAAIPPLSITAQALAFFAAQQIGMRPGLDGLAGDTRQQILNYTRVIETDNDNAVSNIDAWLAQVRDWGGTEARWQTRAAGSGVRPPARGRTPRGVGYATTLADAWEKASRRASRTRSTFSGCEP